eukprot:TRINITY_DN904_c0_g2_i1.p1 TRINITY_DN904_c0_g2~~TRINITY_DN904_c0_g2_i1.p1  ORF type:complete len:673 (+),score=154.70 TRINITY_DN904_c0_g2_i1:63-2021(+)
MTADGGPPGAAGGAPDAAGWRERFMQFYRRWNPEKLDKVDGLLAEHAGQEAVLWELLQQKYGTGGGAAAPAEPSSAAAEPSSATAPAAAEDAQPAAAPAASATRPAPSGPAAGGPPAQRRSAARSGASRVTQPTALSAQRQRPPARKGQPAAPSGAVVCRLCKNVSGRVGLTLAGNVVESVAPGSPAEAAGIAVGTEVLSVNARAVPASGEAIQRAFARAPREFSLLIVPPPHAADSRQQQQQEGGGEQDPQPGAPGEDAAAEPADQGAGGAAASSDEAAEAQAPAAELAADTAAATAAPPHSPDPAPRGPAPHPSPASAGGAGRPSGSPRRPAPGAATAAPASQGAEAAAAGDSSSCGDRGARTPTSSPRRPAAPVVASKPTRASVGKDKHRGAPETTWASRDFWPPAGPRWQRPPGARSPRLAGGAAPLEEQQPRRACTPPGRRPEAQQQQQPGPPAAAPAPAPSGTATPAGSVGRSSRARLKPDLPAEARAPGRALRRSLSAGATRRAGPSPAASQPAPPGELLAREAQWRSLLTPGRGPLRRVELFERRLQELGRQREEELAAALRRRREEEKLLLIAQRVRADEEQRARSLEAKVADWDLLQRRRAAAHHRRQQERNHAAERDARWLGGQARGRDAQQAPGGTHTVW